MNLYLKILKSRFISLKSRNEKIKQRFVVLDLGMENVNQKKRKTRNRIAIPRSFGSGGRTRTYDLRVMSPTSYLCSTPHSVFVLQKYYLFLNWQNFFAVFSF